MWVRKGRFRTKVHRVSYPRIISAQFIDSGYYDYFEVLVSQEKHDDNLSIITRRRGGRRRAEGVMAFIRKSTHPEVEVEVTITQRYRKPGSRPWLPGASNS